MIMKSIWIFLCYFNLILVSSEETMSNVQQKEGAPEKIPDDPGGNKEMKKDVNSPEIQKQDEPPEKLNEQKDDSTNKESSTQDNSTEPEKEVTTDFLLVGDVSSEDKQASQTEESIKSKPSTADIPSTDLPDPAKEQKVEVEDKPDKKADDKEDTQEKSKQEEEIQTFTEWTQKVLEEEKQKSPLELTGSLAKNKRSTNYASKECGAKLLGSNPEAENVKHILTSNRDEYMINPCKASKKWFVIELCEPVHISHFEVATYELFSSQPKTFKISLSDRYPTKEWTNIGEFTATEERIPQTFEVKEGYVVQFVKVEMIDHYGTEHFCPLTSFKSFGVPVEYDEYGHRQHEGSDEDNDNDMDEILLRNGDTNEESDTHKNLFETATNTVMKLVKKVLNVEDKKQEKGPSQNESTPVVNETYSVNVTKDGMILPCVPLKEEEKKDKPIAPSQPSPPQASTGTKTEDESIVTKLEDHEQVPSVSDDLVTLLLGDDEDDIGTCDQVVSNQKPLCRYLHLMMNTKKYPTCSLNESSQQDIKVQGQSEGKDNAKVVVDASSEEKPTEDDKGLKDQDITPNTIVPEPEIHSVEATEVKPSEGKSVLSTSSVTSQKMDQTTRTDQSEVISASSASIGQSSKVAESTNQEEIKPSIEATPDVSQSIQPSSSLKVPENKPQDSTPRLEDSMASKTIEISVVDPSPSHQAEQSTEAKVQQPEVPSPVEDTKIEPASSEPVTKSSTVQVNITEGPDPNVVEPVVMGDNVPAVQDTKDYKLVPVPILPYQKRETAIMRLNNRIKALEMNVSLSSRFLEEMSQKFKKQTEDMIKQHMFNKTITELSNVTKAIEVQSQIQQQKIDVLETTVQNLTEIVVRLTERLEGLNQQVHDRDYRYIVTVLVFCIILLFLVRRKSPKPSSEAQPIKAKAKHPQVVRRNSFSGQGNKTIENLGHTIQRYNSEATLADSKNYSADVDPGGFSNQHIKKKKKKKQKLNGSSTSLNKEQNKLPQRKTDYNSAGLLFGTSSREITPEKEEKKKKVNQSDSYTGIWRLFSGEKPDQKPKGPDKTGHRKDHPVGQKSLRQGKICQPSKLAEQKRNSWSSNGYHSDSEESNVPLNGHACDNDIYIVSPLKKGVSFTKGASQNGHKDPLLKSSTGKHTRKSHTRAGSTDLSLRSLFSNGH